MTAAEELALKKYANDAANGASGLERNLAASVLMHVAKKALEENERLKARRLVLVEVANHEPE